MIHQIMRTLCQERPVGTAANAAINDYLEHQLASMGFCLESLPFDCTVWEKKPSQLKVGERSFSIEPCPFSEGFSGEGKLVYADTIAELEKAECTNSILLLSGILTQTPLQPKNYPFYYPEAHEQLITLLEQKSPKAIVALTGRHPMCGLEPFPFFEDGNFMIPSAYISLSFLDELKEAAGMVAALSISSTKVAATSRQLIATKNGKDKSRKIVLCAHMDSKYHTPGALDNAAGVAVLLETARRLQPNECSIEIVPFNGEEYFAACGELKYLQYLKERSDTVSLLINFDSPCHLEAKSAVSFYNFSEQNKGIATCLFEQHSF